MTAFQGAVGGKVKHAILAGLILLGIVVSMPLSAELLIPMDNSQSNHLKAYGIAFEGLKQQLVGKWLLNYRGGSFLFPDSDALAAL